ncbi:ATP-binding protein [Pseudomonas petrae]|uniref:ATP-binding protein n=1 Tax=Pseudomonas petrae TaxID=2912190 RepID=A0ABS9ID16_9PSED|nr:ATP-binding protein [Pseudomonas petrae]MCF7537572.1 ATP-binding protein [Pseudomonas petrae]MCF7545622.1 ATP-binding protein [Pseudomonas petrae]
MTVPTILKSETAQCSEHGQYHKHLVESFIGDRIWQGCPRCQFDAVHSPDDAIYKPAAAVRDARDLNARLIASDIPLRFRKATLDNYQTITSPAQQAIALRQCRDYAQGFEANWNVGRSMMLLGGLGTGKTHLGCAIAQHAIREFRAVARYTSALSIIRDVKSTFAKDAELTETKIYEALSTPDLLIVDEVGVQNGSDFERQVLFETINSRYERLQPTIVISNLSILAMRKCLGDRVVDRLSDHDGPAVLFNWASARGEA